MARPVNGVDELSIIIEADAHKATDELNRLSQSINNLSNAVRGANLLPFTNSIRDLKNETKGLNLAPLNTQVNRIGNTMNKYAQNANKLGSANRLASSSFSMLSRGFGNVFSGLSSINNKVDTFASKIRRADKETRNFAQTIGLLYARFFLLIRGAKGLMTAIKSSMDYIEVLNYFDNSFGKVAEHGVSKWSEMGYESAQAYYDSFKDRAKKITADMSGFFPEENGQLTPTKQRNLGMNPQDLMKYQSLYVQVADSMGVTAEQSAMLSDALVKIGADLASIRNEDFDKTWQNMASGLVGMTKTMRQYGVNISVANMNMKLHELGIDATVNKLSEADKALLRTIILLNSSTGAWGDLSRTLNTPANQLRMLTNNIKLLGQMIGNLFIPMISKLLPYLNAFVIALQRLFTWLAKILHIDLSESLGAKTNLGGDELADLLGDAEDLSDALEDDAKATKKLKRQLQGFDALNNLTSKDDSGSDKGKLASGLLDDAFLKAYSDYLKAWEDAFNKIENKAQNIADKIEKFFKRLTKPIFEAWKKVGDKVVQQWKNAGYNLKLLFKQIGKDFWRVWEQPQTERIFENIFTVFGNIGEVVQHLSNRFREAWVENDNGFKVLQAIRDIILIISEKAKEMSESFVEWSKDLNLRPLMAKMAEFMESMKPVIETLMDVLKDFLNDVLLPLGKWTLEKGLPKLLQVFIDFKNKVNWEKLKANLKTLWEHLKPFAEKVGEGFILFLERASTALADFLNSKKFEDFLKKLEDWMDKVSKEDIADFFGKLAKFLVELKVALMAWKVLSPVIKIIAGLGFALVGLGKGLGAVWKFGKWFIGGGLGSAFAKFGASVGKTAGTIGATLGKIVQAIGGFGAGVSKAITSLGGMSGIFTMDLGTIFGAGTFAEIGVTIASGIFAGFVSAWAGFNVGKVIGKIFTDDDQWYENFSWFGEGGFFDELDYYCNEMLPQTLGGAKEKLNVWFENDVSPIFDMSKWLELFGVAPMAFNLSMAGIAESSETATFKEWIEKDVEPYFASEFWVTLTGGAVTGWETTMNAFHELYEQSSFKKLIDEKIKPMFTEDYWKSIFWKMVVGFSSVFAEMRTRFGEMKNNVVRFANDIAKVLASLAGAITRTNQLTQNYHAPIIRNTSPIRMHANGGFVEDGLFMANHNELIGQFSNGKTAVANNEQIVSGIQNGVYGAMSESNAILLEQNALLRAILEKETGINASDIFKSVQRSASDYAKQYGRPAFN